MCGNSNVHFVAKNFDGLPNASLVQRSICNYFELAAKSFIQCINNYENVQKQIQSAEISTKMDDLNCLESMCNAFIINEIYTVDNQGNTEISANTNEQCGLQCCARDK